PTLLPAADLVRMLGAIRDEFGLADDAEITTEANPESVDPAYLEALREGGFNRVSFGMQSAKQHVLKILDRTHTPGRPEACVAEARAAGFDHVNLDLIYGTPGESDDDWRATLDAAIGAGPDHVSAYALIVEEGTQLARRMRSPGAGREVLAEEDRRVERILLELRLREGCPLDLLKPDGLAASRRALTDGLLEEEPYDKGRAVLTLRGRLLADAVVRDLVD
ncbi:radical SAM protein, partial [Streptomyces sp. MBT72]|uniref:coproporphyrinogen-III oxidase family protein n=1 Tax=Streptomyces sp. MBT72 TaxID=1488402 RepID=UPI00191659DF